VPRCAVRQGRQRQRFAALLGKQCARQGQQLFAEAIGEQAVAADAYETLGQHMQEEAAEEVHAIEGHDALLSAVNIIAPAEADAIAVEGGDAVVGNGHAVGVAPEIAQDLLRPAEGRLGVDVPLLLAQAVDHLFEVGRVTESRGRTAQLELARWDEEGEATRLALVRKINYRDPKSVQDAIGLLRHDEHIQAATRSGILNLAFVISFQGSKTESEEEREYREKYPDPMRKLNAAVPPLPPRPHHYLSPESGIFVLPPECWVGCQALPHNDDCHYKVSRRVLEADYLKRQFDWAEEMADSIGLSDWPGKPYILDIDLDFFHTQKALNPDDPSVFYKLIRDACAITIATEEECTNQYWLDRTGPQIEEVLKALNGHIENAIASA